MKNILKLTLITMAFATAASAAKKEEPRKLMLDTKASQIEWVGKKAIVKSEHSGTVALKKGEININNNQITTGEFEIDMASIENTDLKGNPKQADLVGHLKGEDFFDVQKYPTAKFVIKSVKAAQKPTAEYTHDVSGDLTLKSETHAIAFPAKITMTDKEAMAVASVKIDRTIWNVRYASDKFFKNLGDKVIANDIDLKLNLKATK